VSGTATKPRLTVFRSAKHMYAQVVDDLSGTTLASASTRAKGFAAEGSKTDAAKRIGLALADACKQKGIERVVFDRNGFIYHGRVKALADGAREGGLSF
jgi:large subunit ribosomal protein L18